MLFFIFILSQSIVLIYPMFLVISLLGFLWPTEELLFGQSKSVLRGQECMDSLFPGRWKASCGQYGGGCEPPSFRYLGGSGAPPLLPCLPIIFCILF